jgi:hypothetical protein
MTRGESALFAGTEYLQFQAEIILSQQTFRNIFRSNCLRVEMSHDLPLGDFMLLTVTNAISKRRDALPKRDALEIAKFTEV